MTAKGTRGPYAKTARRRAEITEAALAAVVERGHRNVTTADVAERAGVTESTVLYHFPSKEHLFLAVLTLDRERDSGGFDLATAAIPPLDSASDVAGALGRMATLDTGHRNTLHLFVAMAAEACAPEHPAHGWFLTHHATARATFAAVLRRLQASGEAHPEVDPDRFARQLTAVWDGLQQQWLIDPTFDLGEAVAEAFRTLTRSQTMVAKRAIEALAADI